MLTYEDMFVGSIVTGNIYHFDLDEDRTQLSILRNHRERAALSADLLSDSG